MKLPTMDEPNAEVVELTWDQALTWRVGRQLLGTPATDPVEVTSALGGVQAQVASSALQGWRFAPGDFPTSRICCGRSGLSEDLGDERNVVSAARSADRHLDRRPPTTPVEDHPGLEKYHGVTKSQLDALTEAIPSVLSDEPVTRRS